MSRQRRRLSVQSLETRKLMAADTILASQQDTSATTDDVYVDGNIITAENYDSARLEQGTHDDLLIGGSTTWDADGTSNTLMVGELYRGTVQDNGSGSAATDPDATDAVMVTFDDFESKRDALVSRVAMGDLSPYFGDYQLWKANYGSTA